MTRVQEADMPMLVKHTKPHKSGRVDYRRAYPPSLLDFIPGKAGQKWAEHKVSLGSAGSPGFLSRYEAAAADYESIVSRAVRLKEGAFDRLDAPTIAYLAEAYRVDALEEDEQSRWSIEERSLFASNAASLKAQGVDFSTPWGGQEARRWALKARETLEASLPEQRRLRAEGDVEALVEYWRDEALALAEARGLVLDTRDVEGLAKLCRALNDAAISAGDDRLRRLEGQDVPTPPEPEAPQRAARGAPEVAQVAGERLTILGLYDAYAKAQQMTPGVRSEWRKYIEKLIEFLGHDDAARITTKNIRDWRDELLKEPTRLGLQRNPVTVRDKYITATRAMLAYAVEEHLLPSNVAAEVNVRVPKRVKLREPAFSSQEAKAILAATLVPAGRRVATEHALARRWIPWICAYTGARVNEISQLRKEDVVQVDGVWAIRITPEAGTVKNREAREVPLHAHLIEQGFLEVVEARPSGPLFFDAERTRVPGDSNRHFKKVGERLAEWVRHEVGIKDPGLKPNHAWRHLFKGHSYDVGIEERLADAIQGHAPKTTGRTYGNPSLAAKAEAIAKLPRFEV
jgi:integrase